MQKVWKHGKYLLGAGFLFVTGAARADVGPPGIEWPGWHLESSEHLNLEDGDNNVSARGTGRRVRFPMSNLVDGNPNTAWVWHDPSPKVLRALGHGDLNRKVPRSFTLRSEKPIVASELRLMSGYNRRPDLFRRNDRVVKIRISLDAKPLKTVALADRMGWRAISLPTRAFRSLTIEILGVRKGEGADNDICLSEMALFNRGRKISFGLPKSVVYTLSYCCGGTAHLLSREGRVLGEAAVGDGFDIAWSPSKQFVAGIDTRPIHKSKRNLLWIADVREGRFVRRHPLPDARSTNGYTIR
jgi:hypothetical protein